MDSLYSKLPRKPGVYFFKNKNNEIIYIGKAKDLKARVSSYFSKRSAIGPKTSLLASEIRSLKILIVESEIEALLLEAELIRKYRPKYNVDWKDGKAYPLIKLAVKEQYPYLVPVRREENDGSLYFGPFPNASAMRNVLRYIRKIFPYVSVKNHKNKVCFYYHLNLCPCPQAFNTSESTENYKKTIINIIHFLRGKKKFLLKNLKSEMLVNAKNKNFEEAAIIKKRIEEIEQITKYNRPVKDYINNPNLISDLRSEELRNLTLIVANNFNLPKDFQVKTIEAYDISNIQGVQAVGSQIRFENGDPDKNLYRQYKIKNLSTPNDTAMLKEVLERRLKHTEWAYPDLFLVDGGEPQVGIIFRLFEEKGIKIPLLGLAKRLEEIVIPKKIVDTLSFEKIRFTHDPVFRLLMRIRDEAHRFANKYHHKLTLKNMTNKVANLG